VRAHLPRFLIDRAAAPGDAVPLAADEARHARVRRLAIGDPIALFDGSGRSYLARLESLARAGAVARVTDVLPARDGESGLDLTLAVAALKADRFDWVVEKATELGVTRIQPFTSVHTLARPSRNRQERWRQIALAAAKQCGRSSAPDIAASLELSAVLSLPAATRVVFAEDGSGSPLADLALAVPSPLLAVVGGEGGFTAAELAQARARGCHLIALGPRILRAETAAISAVVLCQARWGDLGVW
jgi:16S rRNA (uracil1498-N3)-methyltransferase